MSDNGNDGEMVLVVEDDHETKLYMQALLNRRYRVVHAASGEELSARLDAHPELAIVLMDLSLKGSEDGLVLTKRLRSDPRWRDLPVVAVTAHALPEDRIRALADGCNEYFSKPLNHTALFDSMTRLIAAYRMRRNSRSRSLH